MVKMMHQGGPGSDGAGGVCGVHVQGVWRWGERQRSDEGEMGRFDGGGGGGGGGGGRGRHTHTSTRPCVSLSLFLAFSSTLLLKVEVPDLLEGHPRVCELAEGVHGCQEGERGCEVRHKSPLGQRSLLA